MRLFAALFLSCFISLAVAQDSVEPLTVPETTMRKLLIHRVKPDVPSDVAGLQGTVVLKAVVSYAGRIEKLDVESGPPMLVSASLAAVKQWKYRPYEVNGIPRKVETTIHLDFLQAHEREDDAPATASESPIQATADDMRSRLIYRVAPKYPPLARQARIQGVVIVSIIVDKSGAVRETQVLSGHPMLAPAAIDAIKKWRYIPYEINEQTIELQTEVQVIFILSDS